MNYHSHERRDEVWTVMSGTGKVIVDGMEHLVAEGDVVYYAGQAVGTQFCGNRAEGIGTTDW